MHQIGLTGWPLYSPRQILPIKTKLFRIVGYCDFSKMPKALLIHNQVLINFAQGLMIVLLSAVQILELKGTIPRLFQVFPTELLKFIKPTKPGTQTGECVMRHFLE